MIHLHFYPRTGGPIGRAHFEDHATAALVYYHLRQTTQYRFRVFLDETEVEPGTLAPWFNDAGNWYRPPEKPNCGTCRFWDSGGDCRRHAPQLVYAQLDEKAHDSAPDRGIWPFVNESDWCGEWRARDS